MKQILNTYNTAELKKFISSTNLKGYSKLKKGELVNFMTKKEHIHHFKSVKERVKAPREVKAVKAVKAVKKKDKKDEVKTDAKIAKDYVADLRKNRKSAPKKENTLKSTKKENDAKINKNKKRMLVKEIKKKGKIYRKQRKDFSKDDPLRKKGTEQDKMDELDESGYSIATFEKLYGKPLGYSDVMPSNAPTYDNGYEIDMSQIEDPLTFDYTVKTPLFYKGVIPFDKKKHDKGIMPKEIWEGIYGEDLDTPSEIIRGNNLTPQMKEDIKLTELKANHELNKTRMKAKAENKAKYDEKSRLHRQKRRKSDITSLPVPQNKLEVVASLPKRKKKGFAPKIVARSVRGAKRSKAEGEARKKQEAITLSTQEASGAGQALSIYDKKTTDISNQGGNQLHPDFRREAKRMGYTDYNSGQKKFDADGAMEGEDWELDPTHPHYKAPIKYSYSHLGSMNKSGVVSGSSGINPLASNTQIRIRGREGKQEDGQATNTQKSKLNAGLLAGIERQKLKKKGIEVKDTNESVFTKKGKQEFADKFIIQAKNVDSKMSKEWMKRYVEAQRKERPNMEYNNKTEAFSKMAEKMFNDYDKESKKSRPLMLKGKEDKYQTQRKEFQDKFNDFNKKAQADLKGNITPAKKKKLKDQLDQKRKRLDINLKKLGEKFNK